MSETEQHQKEQDFKNKTCFKCHKPGHQAWQCPNDPKTKNKLKRKPGAGAARKVTALGSGKVGKGGMRDAKVLQSELTKSQQLNAKQRTILSAVKGHLPKELQGSGNDEAPPKLRKGAANKREQTAKEAIAAFMETIPGNSE